MPFTATVISIFLASPSDVLSDRDVIDQCVADWNRKNGRHNKVLFDLLRWESSFSAGFGSDGQDVINSQNIPYDVLICLFWKRIGTPTPRAVSGTVEEYELALARRTEGERVEIAVFFKNEAFIPSLDDAKQLILLEEFKEKINSSGALSMPYADRDRLTYQIDLLLHRLAREFTGEQNPVASAEQQAAVMSPAVTNDDDDLGMIDAVEGIEGASAEAVEILGEHAADLTAFTEALHTATAELVELNTSGETNLSAKKSVINGLAQKMNHLSASMEARNDTFEAAQMKMLSYMRAMVSLTYDYIGSAEKYDWDSLESFRTAAIQMNSGMAESNESMRGLVMNVASVPRATVEFNKARNKFVTSAERYMAIVERGIDISDGVITELDRLFRQKPRPDTNEAE